MKTEIQLIDEFSNTCGFDMGDNHYCSRKKKHRLDYHACAGNVIKSAVVILPIKKAKKHENQMQ